MLIERKDVQYLACLSINREQEMVSGIIYFHIYHDLTPYLIWQTGLKVYQENMLDGARFWLITKDNRNLHVIMIDIDGTVSQKVALSSVNRYIPEMEMEIMIDNKIYLINTKLLTLVVKSAGEITNIGKKTNKIQVTSKVPYTIVKGADDNNK